MEKAQTDMDSLAEDIGLLQNTFVRSSFKNLPSVRSLAFWGYMWKWVKSKPTAWYS